jgi:hypothetical protein
MPENPLLKQHQRERRLPSRTQRSGMLDRSTWSIGSETQRRIFGSKRNSATTMAITMHGLHRKEAIWISFIRIRPESDLIFGVDPYDIQRLLDSLLRRDMNWETSREYGPFWGPNPGRAGIHNKCKGIIVWYCLPSSKWYCPVIRMIEAPGFEEFEVNFVVAGTVPTCNQVMNH